MKHIPVLALTVLTAAASAQTAPAPAPAAKQSFSYDRVVFNYVSVSGGDSDKGVAVFAQATLGKGLYLSGTATNLENTGPSEDNSSTTASLGYAVSLPKALGISTDINLEVGHDIYAVGLRALIGGGLELGLSYGANDVEKEGPGYDNTLTVSAIYNLGQFVKGLTLNASYADQTSGGDFITTFGIGYSF
jgi:hypothetical protein